MSRLDALPVAVLEYIDTFRYTKSLSVVHRPGTFDPTGEFYLYPDPWRVKDVATFSTSRQRTNKLKAQIRVQGVVAIFRLLQRRGLHYSSYYYYWCNCPKCFPCSPTLLKVLRAALQVLDRLDAAERPPAP